MRQTLRESYVHSRLADLLSVRFSALACADEVFSRPNARSATIGDTIARTIKPFDTLLNGRVSIVGPDVLVGPDLILAVRLTVHELLTNALKYGALSETQGRVAIEWRILDAARCNFRFRWSEFGVKRIRSPSPQGFGMRMIERVLARHVLDGLAVGYEPEGFRFAFTGQASPLNGDSSPAGEQHTGSMSTSGSAQKRSEIPVAAYVAGATSIARRSGREA